jgi:site-specific DNA-methyltransferase (adenine-specific)
MSGRRRPTSTSAFGVGRRESHDASGFYARFTPPVVSVDKGVFRSPIEGKIVAGDARHMAEVEDASVALVVTSPPYFAGKEYEEALGDGHVPASYLDYLQMLRDVFAECVRVLEPGGRMAVNVANLGRKPYRSLSADVVSILQDDLSLLLRGEIVWVKARGATGSCAWGSFCSPANPVLRDLTERVVVASKGRFDRALTSKQRRALELPAESSVSKDEFVEATTDVWEIPAESARRVGHPAPFPVELPQRLIELYTYLDDLVLDPFMGSGSTAVAAVRTSRRYVGYDTDSSYVRIAERRAEEERSRLLRAGQAPVHEGASRLSAKELAQVLVTQAGFSDVRDDVKLNGGAEMSLSGLDAGRRRWFFDVSGSLGTLRGGLRRAEVLWRVLGRAAVVHASHPENPIVLLTTEAPVPGSAGERAWRSLTTPEQPGQLGAVYDVVELESEQALGQLRKYARSGRRARAR